MDAQHVIYVGSKKAIVDLGTLPETIDNEIHLLKTQYPTAQPTIVLSIHRRVDYESFLRLFALVQERPIGYGSSINLQKTVESDYKC